MSIELVMFSNHLLLCHLLASVFPSIRVFSSESALHIKWPKYWSFNFSISPSKEYSGLISFGIDWLDLLAVQGTHSLLQHHSSKSSILWCWTFFLVQLLHSYMTTGKTIALTVQTFVCKVMSLLFNPLSRFILAFLSRSKRPSVSWLQLPSAVIFRLSLLYLPWKYRRYVLCVPGASFMSDSLWPCDPMACSPPGSSVHGLPHARIL